MGGGELGAASANAGSNGTWGHWEDPSAGPSNPRPGWGTRPPRTAPSHTTTPFQSILGAPQSILGAHSPFLVWTRNRNPFPVHSGRPQPLPSPYWEPLSLSSMDWDTPYPSPVHIGSPPVHTGSPTSLPSENQNPTSLPGPYWEPPAPFQSILGAPKRQLWASGLFASSAPHRPPDAWVTPTGGGNK